MHIQKCLRCGVGFLSTYRTRWYCDKCNQKHRHTNRKATREKHDLEFIGVDGEGVNRPDGTHEYVLLSVGDRSLHHEDGSRLTFYDILPFLWECFLDNPSATYVGFYLGYDFTMWLRDLPENRAKMLFSEEEIAKRRRTKSGNNHLPFPVEHRGWRFDILPMKRLRLWQCVCPGHRACHCTDLRMYICDTGSYFQTSFLNAIAPDNWDKPIVTEAEYKTIALGKSDRGQDVIPHGTPIDSEMIEYNILENNVLGRLMRSYNRGLVNIGVRLRRDQWFGPGQAAQSWLKTIGAPTRDDFETATELAIRKALRSSYYGGWFEIFAHGHIPGSCYGYDINSAYPYFQSNLPCALHGTWSHGVNDGRKISELLALKEWTLADVTVRGRHNRIGAMPHRLSTGHILRPNLTRGWYWAFELKAAQDAGLIDKITVHEWYSYAPCSCPPPFSDLADLYLDRLRVGKSTIEGKARRLVYNSTYGKTAQSIGMARYANPFYASVITAKCRTAILRFIATHNRGANDVLMVATDGIVVRHPYTPRIHHDMPRDSSDSRIHFSETELGSWSQKEHNNLTLFMPGVYWDDRTRERILLGEAPTLKSRGISAKALAGQISKIDSLFAKPFEGLGHPEITIPLAFSIVSPKQALARGQWDLCGLVEHELHPDKEHRPTRKISSDPTMKRNPVLFMEDGIIRSVCYKDAFGHIESTPYSRTFGDEEQLLTETYTPDGTIEMLLPGMLNG